MNLLSIDPGLVCCGWAIWRDSQLFRCGLSRTKGKTLEFRIQVHAKTFHRMSLMAHVLVIEKPEIYQQRFLKGDPRDLANLAAVVGGIVAAFPSGDARMVYPKAWKGQIPKEVSERRTLSKLSEIEKQVLKKPQVFGAPTTAPSSLLHNMMDAVGLGLYFLQR